MQTESTISKWHISTYVHISSYDSRELTSIQQIQMKSRIIPSLVLLSIYAMQTKNRAKLATQDEIHVR